MKETGSFKVWTDEWTLVDRLGFSRYVETLGQVIVDADTPLAIGVFGSWGSGKTSLMRMLEDSLENHARTVWFDAWKYDREDVLWRALLVKVLDAVRKYGFPPDGDRLEQDLQLLEESIYHEINLEQPGKLELDLPKSVRAIAKYSIKLSLSMIPGLSLVSDLANALNAESADLAHDLLDSVTRKRTELHRNHVRFLEQFQQQFSEIVSGYFLQRGYRLVIFIDDLDRCLPEKSIEVLEAIKLFLDVPGCVFILGLDKNVIERGIRDRYGSPSSSKGSSETDRPISGADYLEKIIQLPFFLPPIQNDDAANYIRSLVGGESSSVIQVFLVGVEGNPRKIKRAVNTFLFLRALSEKEGLAAEIQEELLAKIVVIQQIYRDDIYSNLVKYPSLLADLESYFTKHPHKSTATHVARVDSEARMSAASVGQDKFLVSKYSENEPLRALLLCGQRRFGNTRIEPYVYLARTTTDGVDLPVASQEDVHIWNGLMSNDYVRVERAVAQIDLERLSEYIESLLETIGSSSRSINHRMSAAVAIGLLGDPRTGQTVVIPAGEFLMGSDLELLVGLMASISNHVVESLKSERPRRSVFVDEFEIDILPVTNRQYHTFIEETGTAPPEFWKARGFPKDRPNHPVVGVSWFDANRYAEWIGGRLPTEVEWEKAARGLDGREWPWGEVFDSSFCNSSEAGIDTTTPVGVFPQGMSPFGLYDTAGNVWEWTFSEYSVDGEPDAAGEGKAETPKNPQLQVLRGGSFFHDKISARCSFRNRVVPELKNEYIGFRCCRR